MEYTKDGILVEVSDKKITIELTNISVMKNKPLSQERISILTRVQAGNNWKNRHFNVKNNKFPGYVQNALDELEVLL